MLALSPDVGYIPEPFGLHHRPGHFATGFSWWFPYINAENETPYLCPVSDMLAFRYRTDLEVKTVRSCRDAARLVRDYTHFALCRRTQARPLLKDPLAVFSAEWFASRFHVQPVILIRHPAAFAASLKRLAWSHPFSHFLEQPLLMRDFLSPYRPQIEEFAQKKHPIVDQAILLWQLIHHVIRDYQMRHPDWLFVRHEDVSRRPVEEFRKIFDYLDVPFGSAIQRRILEHSAETNPIETADPLNVQRNSRDNIWKWRQTLSEEEIQRIRFGVEPLSREFYGPADWDPDWQPAAQLATACQGHNF